MRMLLPTIGAMIALIPLATTSSPRPRYHERHHHSCQAPVEGHKHVKHVKHVHVDPNKGEVKWTFHNGTSIIFSKAPSGRLEGRMTDARPVGFEGGHELWLRKMSEKAIVWCRMTGEPLPRPSKTPPQQLPPEKKP